MKPNKNIWHEMMNHEAGKMELSYLSQFTSSFGNYFGYNISFSSDSNIANHSV